MPERVHEKLCETLSCEQTGHVGYIGYARRLFFGFTGVSGTCKFGVNFGTF